MAEWLTRVTYERALDISKPRPAKSYTRYKRFDIYTTTRSSVALALRLGDWRRKLVTHFRVIRRV